MNTEVHIPVRTLVEYVYSSGSIDLRFRTQTSLQDGTRLHKKVQSEYDISDQREVFLNTEIQYEGLAFLIDGRFDGLLFRDGEVLIDEIKSFSTPLENLDPEGYEVHWAQAKMYAYMYAKESSLTEISVQLTYIHVETEETRKLKKVYSYAELSLFADEMVKSYAPFALLQTKHRFKRNESIKDLSFPFESYRQGQRKLAGAVYKTILEEKSLFAQAPTGIGKTISTLFPAVKAIGEGLQQRIFYLTAKTITRTTAEEAFERMRSGGLCMKSVTITAKDKVCFKEETRCQKEYCEFADGYYDRINEAILDILGNEESMTREVIETYARKHRVCPFEFSLDLAYTADAIICDYNYIFDPRVSLKRLLEEQKKSTVLLVDEAHNLVDRGREMFSAEINKSIFLQLKKEYKGINQELFQAASKVNSMLLLLKKANEDQTEFVLKVLDEELVELLNDFVKAGEKALLVGGGIEGSTSLMDAYFMAHKFIKISAFYDDHYVVYGEKSQNDITLKLFCLDPSSLLTKMGKGFKAKVFFSATFSPIGYFQEILGGEDGEYTLSLPSPFAKDQVEVFIKPVSTRYKDRDHTKEDIVKLLHSLVNKRPGNYLIFFPSYQYLIDVYEQFKLEDEITDTLIQETGMKEEAREAFLKAFKPDETETLLGFAVLGGIFSEGIDLVGDRLNGVVVVGVGLPQLCFERNLIKEHYYKKEKNGYDYAYVFPGMNKVLQAGGRLIRSESDRGTIVLVDDRFLKQPYSTLLPPEWQGYKMI